MIALEVKNRIQSTLGVAIPVAQFLQGPSASELAKYLADEIARSAQLEAPALPSPSRKVGIALDELSEGELDQLLAHLEASDQDAA
jgi:hypothetical protein